MLLSKTLKFYKRKEVQSLLVHYAKDKEIAVRFKDYFGKRPDTLMYDADIIELAKKKATSFHCSEELWINPLQISSDLKKQELDNLRKGWDLILDIDCHHFVYSKIATHILIKILKDQGIESISCKFSGNKGFHIAVPFEAFPEDVNGTLVKDLFPEAPRKIAFYLRDKLRPLFERAILKYEKNDINNIMKRTGMAHKDLVMQKDVKAIIDENTTSDKLNVDSFLEIDTILIASRHLYRMPYSLHEKSELVSVPVDINKILKFSKKEAEPENVKFDIPFIQREKAKSGEANQLFINAYDFNFDESKSSETKERKEFKLPETAIREELFPPCIKFALNGMKDGKKRMLFTLTNFMRGAGWGFDAIELRLNDWNKKNPEPLRQVLLNGQLRQLKKNKDVVAPHNCPQGGTRYFQDLQLCHPDSFCSKIKNPLQYSKLKYETEKNTKGKSELTNEQVTARNFDKVLTENIIEKIKPFAKLSSANVLDVGCGDGKKGRYLAQKSFSYTGIDLDEQRIRIASNLVKSKKITFFNDSFENFQTEKLFDVVYFIFSWRYMKNFNSILKKLKSLLSDKGVIVIVEPSEKTENWKSPYLRKSSKDFDENIFNETIEKINLAINILKNSEKIEIINKSQINIDYHSLYILRLK
ncbi:methyltransferase domain-containing protein [Candidatus Woesearchaeota archaeon]|nr:methyltransferase domain-containing protein [Candidatus Woesearchaeota archaeon]MCF7901661.1 methyltransferase domain-containing protein [Candidatus Woesearchaeota archaeon]MCF8013335.1 methyltransferase domain-containing protein [Candidatus Woesearchaeota archaeon]